jgi:hypothetical protein
MFSKNLLYAMKNGGLNTSQLQSLLVADSSYRDALTQIYTRPGLIKELILSDEAMSVCFGSEKAGELFVGKERPFYDVVISNFVATQTVKHLIRNKYCSQYLFPNNQYHILTRTTTFRDAFKTMFNANPNDFALKRQVFTSSGTWTRPSTLSFLAVTCVGGGGNTRDTKNYVTGGSGGETKNVVLYSSFPSSDVTVTISDPSSVTTAGAQVPSTSFGSTCIAEGGRNAEESENGDGDFASKAGTARLGGGSTTGGGRLSCDDVDLQNCVVNTRNFSVQGGNSGLWTTIAIPVAPTLQGLTGTLATITGTSPNFTITSPTGFGNGGAPGNPSTTPISIVGGNNTGNGASGRATNTGGGTGLCVVWWVE